MNDKKLATYRVLRVLGAGFLALGLVFIEIPTTEAALRTVSFDSYAARERAQSQRNSSFNDYYSGSGYSYYYGPNYQPLPVVDFASTRPPTIVRQTKTVAFADAFSRDADESDSSSGSVAGISESSFVVSDIKIDASLATIRAAGEAGTEICGIQVTWRTDEPTAGQVLYGTKSQADLSLEEMSYPFSVQTSPSFSRVHGVTFDCLQNQTYYFRIVALSQIDRAVSDERILVPFTPEAGVAAAVDSDEVDTDRDGASVLGTIGRFGIPIAFIIFLIVIGYYVVRWIRGQMGGGERVLLSRGEADAEEPLLNIPGLPKNGDDLEESN